VRLDLTAAGAIFAIVQVTGIFGRILLGGMADRLGSAMGMLCVSAFSSALTTVAFACMTPEWPWWSLALLAAIAGVTVSSWNGLMLAEVAAAVPLTKVAEATSGTTLLVFLGYIIGPVGFALVLDTTASYSAAFLMIAAVTAISGAVLLSTLRR